MLTVSPNTFLTNLGFFTDKVADEYLIINRMVTYPDGILSSTSPANHKGHLNYTQLIPISVLEDCWLQSADLYNIKINQDHCGISELDRDDFQW